MGRYLYFHDKKNCPVVCIYVDYGFLDSTELFFSYSVWNVNADYICNKAKARDITKKRFERANVYLIEDIISINDPTLQKRIARYIVDSSEDAIRTFYKGLDLCFPLRMVKAAQLYLRNHSEDLVLTINNTDPVTITYIEDSN